MSVYGLLLVVAIVAAVVFSFRFLLDSEENLGIAVAKIALVWVLVAIFFMMGNLLAPQIFHDADSLVGQGWTVIKEGPGKMEPLISIGSSQTHRQSSQAQPQPQAQAPFGGGQVVQNFAPTPTPEPPKPPKKGDTKWDNSPALVLAECYRTPQNLLLISLQKGGFPLGVQWKLSANSRWAAVLPESMEGDWTMTIEVLGVGSWKVSLDPSIAHSIKDQWGSSGVGQLSWPRVPMIYDGTQWVPNGDCVWP